MRGTSPTRNIRKVLNIQKISGVNHPVFKDKPVNHDPREVFIRELLAGRGEYNVFHEFYRTLVQTLFDARRVAQCLLRQRRCSDCRVAPEDAVASHTETATTSGAALETAAFTIFLYPRMLGCAAEIDDHMNRGRNMDTRTPASQCQFVA